MKTILIVIAGMADTPDRLRHLATPMEEAHIPSMDLLSRRGDLTILPGPEAQDGDFSHPDALLTLLGYDLQRGKPSVEELMEYGLDHSARITSYPSLRPFVIPGFSGHGVCVTTSAWARGAAKCALLKPMDIYSPGAGDTEILNTIADVTIKAITLNEFVLVYVDTPLKASFKGDYNGKIAALESIDRHLVTPVADFVWKSELMLNLAVTTDLVTPWHLRREIKGDVPALVYFNNHDWEGMPDVKFTEIKARLMNRNLKTRSDLIRYLSNFAVEEEES